MSGPKNVTPGLEESARPDESFRARYASGRPATGDPEWRAWSWPGGGRRFPWLGVVLVLLGLALLVQYMAPGISLSSLVILALGVAFAAAWLLGRAQFAMIPALLLLALAAARLLGETGLVVGAGITPLLLGAALLLIWGIGRARGRRHGWALWVGAILALYGLAQLAGRLPGIPDLGFVWPILLIAGGVLLLLGGRFAGRDAPP